MKTLITGVAGFIGSHLSEKLLSLGHEVVGIDNFDNFYTREIKERNLQASLLNSNFTFYELDISKSANLEILESNQFELIVHIAAKAGVRPSIENPELYIENNMVGTLNMLELMRKINCKKMVFASSSSVYGNNIKTPFDEEDNTDHQISPYAVSKKSCELLNYSYHKLYDFDIVNLRFFTVYGPRQRPDLAIHKFVKKMSNEEPIEVFGDGNSARDYTFISDTISGIVGAINYLKTHDKIYEIINLGNNTPITLKSLIDKIEASLNCKANLLHKPMQEGDVDITYACIEKAGKLLNYSPKTSLEEGLREFINWYRTENINQVHRS